MNLRKCKVLNLRGNLLGGQPQIMPPGNTPHRDPVSAMQGRPLRISGDLSFREKPTNERGRPCLEPWAAPPIFGDLMCSRLIGEMPDEAENAMTQSEEPRWRQCGRDAKFGLGHY